MSEAKKATCTICGKKYDLCLSCKKQLSITPWKEVADTEVCYKLYMCLLQYNNGYLSKEEAQKQLSNINYNLEDLRDSVRDNINKILSDSKSVKKISEKGKTSMNSN